MAVEREDKQTTRVALTTLGCKVNQFESASFVSGLTEGGARIVPFNQAADVYVVNTCAVTGKAAAQSRQMIRRALKANPQARLVVTGCYAQVAAREIQALDQRSICVVGNGCKDQLVDIVLAGQSCELEMFMGDISRKREICTLPVERFPGRTRAYLKVQDGCNRFCSYCIVPYARGRSRSLPLAQAVAQAETFIRQGYREIVLTGIHIGMYGQDLTPETDLVTLVEALLRLPGSVRFRISSLESAEITEPLLALLAASNRLVPHLHIPLQSGDSRILRRMNRPYTAAEYQATVERCLDLVPDLAVGVDVMVGFPGEDAAAFANTQRLLASLPVAGLHVFPYSRRPQTVAAEFADQIPKAVKQERAAILRELDHQKRTAYYGRFLGTTRQVLAENSRNRFRLMRGFSDNYIPVHFAAPERLRNQFVQVTITRLVDDNVFGELVPEPADNHGEGGKCGAR